MSDSKNSIFTSDSSEGDENDDVPHWQQTILKNFFKESPIARKRSQKEQNKRSLSKRPSYKPRTPSSGPSEKQLSAPYIEEVQPEKPNYMRHLSDTQSSVTTPRKSVEGSISSTHLRDYLKRASLLNTINRTFINYDREHLRDTENFEAFVFLDVFTIPHLWAKTDYKGRKAPPVIFDALKLAITDSCNEGKTYNWQSVFRIELEYGDVKWVIKRTGFDFIALYINLKRGKNLPHIPRLPIGLENWYKAKIRNNRQTRQIRNQAAALQRRKDLKSYLIELIRTLKSSVAYELYEFLELSAISVTRDMGWKGKECFLDIKIERFRSPIWTTFKNLNEKWIKEWVIVRDSYIAFCSDISSSTPTDIFLMDKYLKYDKIDRVLKLHDHVNIENSSRRIEIKGDPRNLKEFLESIDMVKKASPWVKQHRFNSYAPIRENAKVKWYVDGKDYFISVSQAIMAARSEIYIEDWWLSPELYLRRPPSKNEGYRLDNLLVKKAEEGVMIYIIVYKEVKLALTLDSWHTKSYLQRLHPNIKVQRHPDHGPDGTVFWAHHEKMLIVDSKIAFIGGLDLCFGRYDTRQHEMVDFDPNNDNLSIWPGMDYSNPRIKDFINVADYNVEIIDKSRVPRMPWHDVSIGVIGTPARDVARHFVQRWNFIKEEKAFEREKIPFLTPKGEYVSTRDESKFLGSCEVQLLRSSAFWSSGIQLENSIYNAYCHLIRQSKHFIYIENQFFITATEKDPSNTIKNRIGECILERIKKAHENKERFRIIVVMPLLPAFEADSNFKDAGTIRMVMHWQYISICRGGKSILEKISEAGINPENYISFFALRGHDKIHHIIDDNDKGRKSFSSKGPRSKSSKELRSESITKIKNNSRVSLVETQKARHSCSSEVTEDLFFGERAQYLRTDGEPAIPNSIQQMDPKQIYLTEEIYVHSKLMIVDDIFVICGSANINDRSQLGDRDSEIAIIIEDKKTINTRMDGKEYKASKFAYTLRSSLFKEHLGLLEPQDHTTVTKSCLPPLKPGALLELLDDYDETITLLGERNSSQKFMSKKHFTKEDLVVMDPLSDDFYNYWSTTARNNTEIYRSIFRCVPDDNVTDWEQYKKFAPDPTKMHIGHVANPDACDVEVKKKLSNIRGHLVQFPTQFLNKENLMGSIISNAVTVGIFT